MDLRSLVAPVPTRRWSRIVAIAIALSAAPTVTLASGTSAPRITTLPATKCPVFPANNVWNTPITNLPVDSHSASWLAAMKAATTNLHPDYGPSGTVSQPYGIPWTLVAPTTKFTSVRFTYSSESDRGPYPLSAGTKIESGSDRHALMVDPRSTSTSSACTLFETFNTHYRSGGRSTAGSGAIWKLTSNTLRPANWTSADAAGLPILAGLVNYDEVSSGAMNHAIRFTVNCTQQSYLWPARHQAGQSNNACPPMGARFRLNATFTLPPLQCGAFCQTVLTTMKTYGLILADNGSNWYFQGVADPRWTYDQVDQLKQIPASQFVAVNESCLQVAPNSAQAFQPGTSAYSTHCA